MRKLPLPLILGVAALLPLADHADQATCCNATTSLAATINNPVVGDEAFFKLPSGPSNVMFLLDTSGSMSQFPQCGDWSWDDASGLATCKSPSFTLGNPPSKNASPTYTVTGTCTPDASGLTTSTSSLKWMEAVTPQTGYADPGRTNALLWDCPAWGNGGSACGTKVCSGAGCLFDPTAYYTYGDWSAIGGAGPGSLKWYPTTTPRALDAVTTATTAVPTAPCTALDASGNVIVDAKTLAPVSLGDACTTCMATRGFYLYRINYYDASGTLRTVTQPLFKGTFLNANPPKFVTARKVLKDIAWMDPAAPRSLDQIRLGLSVLDSGGAAPRKARLIVPLGPDKSASYPPTQAGFRQARQYLLSVLNYDTTRYADASGNVVVDGTTSGTTGFQNGFFDPTAGSTPLGSALFNVGQYFTAASPPWTSLYAATFGASGCGGRSCVTSEFAESSAGRTNAAWVTKAGNVQRSICWGCQASSVVIVTDGSPNIEISFPSTISTFDTNGYALAQNCNGTYAAETFVGWANTTFKCIEPNTGKAAGVPRVADWLHTQAAAGKLAPAGLRYDLVLGGGQKALTVDTIGVNVTDARAIAILNATANLGGGIFQNAADPGALASAVYNAVNRVTPRDISFSSASSNSLQTVQTSASQAFVTRFRPNTTNAWEGHAFEAFVFDEFQAGCDPCKTVQPTVSCGQTTVKQVSADFNGDGQCGGTFLVDQDCDEIVEDTATGNFLKKGTTEPANVWDAGQVLSFEKFPGPVPAAGPNPGYRTADETAPLASGATCASGLCRRNIFTWIAGQRMELTTANAATLLPYLNVSSAWCTSFLAQIGVSGGSNASLECAKEIIHYVRGWDVLDQDGDGCAGPGKANSALCQRGAKGEERDRPSDGPVGCTYGKDCSTTPVLWKLGDVSHSSPAVIQVPIHESVCASGWENQCTWAIYGPPGRGPPTKMDASCTASDCYLDWRAANLARRRVELVGSNDGMLHAFDAGTPRSPRARDLFVEYTNGTGAELWAFVPPDLLPRLKDLLSAHQYMVDGSVMLRDVWVDGTQATDGQETPGVPSGQDGQKQVREFHTVAVFGRRAGGNQYSALDVTDPLKPTFLWNFPKGGSSDARIMGQSWSDFAPRPPPIVPVRLATTASSPRPDRDRGFSERWVVLLGGGYDPTLTLGRAVFMLDAWTGATVWRFTDDDFKASMGYSSSSAPSLFPVTAVGAVDMGDPTKVLNGTPDSDSFFDTATWGDLGGNVWVARFDPPGAIDPSTGRVGNWFAARTFEQLRRTDDAQYVSGAGAGRNEFFYMPANTIDPEAGALYTFLGSGNREQLLSQGPSCGTDNLMACCQAGCSVSAATAENYGAVTHSDAFSCSSAGLLTHGAGDVPAGSGDATCAAAPGNLYSASVNVAIACPGASAVSASGSASCDGSGLCTVTPVGTVTSGGTLAPRTHNRFYGIKAFGGGDPAKAFGDLATARTFERNRSTDVPFAGTCAGTSCTLVNTTQAAVSYAAAPSCGSTLAVATTCADGSAKCTASSGDAGWYYELGDRCPVGSCPTPPPWTDEKTGAGANIIHGCTMWGGFRPHGMTTSTDPCSGTQGVPTVYDYAVNTFTGAPDGSCSGGYSAGIVHAASQRSVTAAPGGVMARVDVNAQGQIGYSGKTFDSGSSPGSTSAGTASAGGNKFYWLEVPQQLHACRHVDRTSCE